MENENDKLADAQERVLKLLKDRFSDRKELKKQMELVKELEKTNIRENAYYK